MIRHIHIDLLKTYQKHHYASFFENLIPTGCYHKISLQTKCDSNNLTATLIDNIIDCNTSGASTNSISGHQMIHTFSNDGLLITKKTPKYTRNKTHQ